MISKRRDIAKVDDWVLELDKDGTLMYRHFCSPANCTVRTPCWSFVYKEEERIWPSCWGCGEKIPKNFQGVIDLTIMAMALKL